MSIRLGGDERQPASNPWLRIRTEQALKAGQLLVGRMRSAVTGRDPGKPMRARLQHTC